MKRETQNDLRYIKTEELIQATFREMIKEADYSQLSVKDLTERAKINRKTFYLHYPTMDDLLWKMQEQLYDRFIEATQNICLPADLEKLVRLLFLFWSDAKDVNSKILGSHAAHLTGKLPGEQARRRAFHRRYSEEILLRCTEVEMNVIDAFLDGSLSAIYIQWDMDGRKIPFDEIVALASQFVSKGLHFPSLLD